MRRKANVLAMMLVIVLVIVFLVSFLGYQQDVSVRRDKSSTAMTESRLAVSSAAHTGVSNALSRGFSLNGTPWYCNHLVAPNVSSSNRSLRDSTRALLDLYFGELTEEGYVYDVSNATHDIRFPENDSTQVKIPGKAVIVTDLSGSMGWYVDGRRKDRIAKQMDKILVQSAYNETDAVKIGLVQYSGSAGVVHHLTDEEDELYEAIDNMRAPNGGTCVACGIYKAVRMLVPPPPPSKAPKKPLSIVIMSDGVANVAFDQSNVDPDCLLLDDTSGPMDQAIEYARQAHDDYNITFYTVGFYSSSDDPAGAATMQQIANVGGGNYAESDNPSGLADIYDQFGQDVAQFLFKNFSYLKLDNDLVKANVPHMSVGFEKEDFTRTNNLSASFEIPYSSWYLYKHVLNWFVYMGNDLTRQHTLRDQLTSAKGCKGVFYNSSYGGCPPAGKRHISKSKRDEMALDNEDLRPLKFKEELADDLNAFMSQLNITCGMHYSTINLTNHFIYDYRSSPSHLTVGQVFGNGSYMQAGDGVDPRLPCARRSGSLGTNASLGVGNIGPDAPVSSCGGGGTYEYVGVDRTAHIVLDVSCKDPDARVMYAYDTVTPVRLDFKIVLDVMNNCEPPEDTTDPGMVC